MGELHINMILDKVKEKQKIDIKTKSNVAVKGSTAITVTSSGLIVTTENGTPAILSLADLSLIGGPDTTNAK